MIEKAIVYKMGKPNKTKYIQGHFQIKEREALSLVIS